jgi:hypothetical protein
MELHLDERMAEHEPAGLQVEELYSLEEEALQDLRCVIQLSTDCMHACHSLHLSAL